MNHRLDQLQPYPFERLRELHADVVHQGSLAHIPLSLGEPKHAPPGFVIDALADRQAMAKFLATYPASRGSEELRQSISQWLNKRFAVTADAEQQVLPVYGTREALFAVSQALLRQDPKSYVGMPNPFYQIYEGAALLAGVQPLLIANDAQHAYQADFGAVTPDQWQRMQALYICSPGNPTGHIMPEVQMRQLIELAHEHDFFIISDECYSELYFDDAKKPISLLEVSQRAGNGFKRCLSFHSLSKRSNLPGLRSGFVAGDTALIERFLRYRTYHGCALAPHHQHVSTLAWQDEAHVVANRDLYREKFAQVSAILSPHYDLQQPDGGFYHWLRTPIDDLEFSRRLLAEQNLTVVPGSFLSRDTAKGNPGKGHVRVAWVAPLKECVVAAERLAEFGQKLG